MKAKIQSDKSSFYDEDTGKQLKPLPAHWIVPHKGIKVGGKVKLLNHIALRLGSRGPEFKNWDQIVTILEIHNGRGSFPSRWNAVYECYDTQQDGYLVVDLPYPYSVETLTGKGTFKTLCHLSTEGTEWEIV